MLSRRARGPVWFGLLGALVAGSVLVLWVWWIPEPSSEYFPAGRRHAFVSVFDPPTRPVEVAVNGGDGQAYAALAMDPTLARPEVFSRGATEAAYRAQRPLAGWVAWALSAGRPTAVPYALAVIAAAGVGVFVAAAAALARDLGRRARAVPALLAAPGVVTDLKWLCPDALAAGLGLAGLVWWRRNPDRPWRAVGLLSLAVLTRESTLVLVGAMVVDGVARGLPRRALMPLLVPPLVFAVWVSVVRVRLGAWPTQAAGSDRLSLPFVGFAQGMGFASTISLVCAVAVLGVTVCALARRPEPLLARVLVLHLGFAAVMGRSVWGTWTGAGRALLPMVAVAVIVLLPARHAPAPVEPRPLENVMP